MRSQSGPLSSVPFTAMPIHRVSKLDFEPFRVLLLRRFRLPLPFTVCTCRCGRPLDAFAPPRSVQHRRASGQEGFRSRECHRSDISEGGARVSTNVMVGTLTSRHQRHQGVRHHNREQGGLLPSSLKAFEEECPFQHALSRVGGIASILSDGAHDHILRSAMLGRPHAMPEARSLLPFVRLSCGQPSTVENKGILKLFCSPSEFRRHSRKW